MEIWPVVFAFAVLTGVLLWDRFRKPDAGRDAMGEVRKLESRVKIVETEWADAYDKLGRLASRLTKERGLLEKAGGSGTTTSAGAEERPRSRMQILSRGGQ